MTAPSPLARPVEARVKANEFVEAGPHDVRLGPPVEAPDGYWSPYALSNDLRTAWWVRTDAPLHRATEPFYYLAQYHHATHLARASSADLAPASDAPRRFVFSVGRCGSTLLSDLARRAGLTTLSEPDALTPLALDREPPDSAAALYPRVVDACLEGWRTGASETPALIKLRAQHSNARHLALIVQSVRRPSFTFVFREPRAWARSMAGHFALPVERLVALYAAPVAALVEARRARAEVRTLTYEAMIANPDAALRAVNLPPGAANAPDASSQSGTRLARPPEDTPAVRRTVDAFMERWPDIRADAAELGW